MADEQFERRAERWKVAWQKPKHDTEKMLNWALDHGQMKECMAGLLRAHSFYEPLSESDVELMERVGDETIKPPKT